MALWLRYLRTLMRDKFSYKFQVDLVLKGKKIDLTHSKIVEFINGYLSRSEAWFHSMNVHYAANKHADYRPRNSVKSHIARDSSRMCVSRGFNPPRDTRCNRHLEKITKFVL